MNSVSLVDGHIDGADTCVICGRDIPEGRQVCVICGYKAEKKKPDLVEVVRCGECKHFSLDYCGICGCGCGLKVADKNQFCSYGERKGKE